MFSELMDGWGERKKKNILSCSLHPSFSYFTQSAWFPSLKSPRTSSSFPQPYSYLVQTPPSICSSSETNPVSPTAALVIKVIGSGNSTSILLLSILLSNGSQAVSLSSWNALPALEAASGSADNILFLMEEMQEFWDELLIYMTLQATAYTFMRTNRFRECSTEEDRRTNSLEKQMCYSSPFIWSP